VALSWTGKSWKKGYCSWEVLKICLTEVKKYEMYGRQQGELTWRSWE